MLKLAFTNLAAKKARTLLALLGLMIAILGVIGLISISGGIETLFHETLTMVEGITVLNKEMPSPVMSRIPEQDGETIEREVPGVEVAIPTIMFPAFKIEDKNTYLQGRIFDMYAIIGTDPAKRKRLKDGGVFNRHLLRGRPLEARAGDAERAEVMISKDAAAFFGKDVGQKLRVWRGFEPIELEVVGIFHTGSIILDRQLVVPLGFARELAGVKEGVVCSFYVETKPGANPSQVGRDIEARLAHLDARTPEEAESEFAFIFRDLDIFLAAIGAIAILVGAVGVVNTMLMSVTERVTEFGVLRATGWTRRDVLRLVVCESAAIGVIGGLAGCAAGAAIVRAVGLLLPVRPVATPSLLAASFVVAIALGVLGGLYPAWRASRLDPIHAIRHI